MKLLILCTGNSCRSQMAEGFMRHYAQSSNVALEVVSAGVETHGLNPRAVKVMAEAEVDISGHKSELVDNYLGTGITHLFTVCDHANETCPMFPEPVNRTHHSFPDPAQANGTEEEIMASFRSTRDQVKAFCKGYISGLTAKEK